MIREMLIRFLVENAATILSVLVVSVLPALYWVHQRVRAGIVGEAKDADDEREKRSVERFGDVEVRLVRLEDGQGHITDDVGELKRDTKEIRIQLNEIHASVEYIRATLNGARRPE